MAGTGINARSSRMDGKDGHILCRMKNIIKIKKNKLKEQNETF